MDASQDSDVMQLFNAENDLLGVVSDVSLPEPVYKKIPSDDPSVADEVTLASLGILAFSAEDALVEAVRQEGFTKLSLRSPSVEIIGRGVLKKENGKAVLKLSYYKESREGKRITEIDPFHMVEVINGLDLGQRAREALGLSPEDL